MRRVYIPLLTLIFASISIFAQNAENKDAKGDSKGKVVQNNYARNAISVVCLDFDQDKYASDLKTAWDKLVISDKFDNNQLENIKAIKANFDMRLGNCAGGGAAAALLAGKDTSRPGKMAATLNQEKFAHKIISKWFNMTPDGTVSLETIFKRGMYNATDADYKKAMDSKRAGADLKDAGYELINNSYIAVIDFGNIMTMEEYYDQMEQNKKLLNAVASKAGAGINLKQKRPKTGYITDIKAYLFKVDYNADVNQTFFEMFQEIKGDDQHWKIDKAKYDAMNVPIKFVAQVSFPRVEGNEYKTGHILAPATPSSKEQLFVKLVNNGFDNAAMMMTRKVEAFRVKAPAAEAKGGFFPYAKAKIGKKEDIRLDKRFFVWEKVEVNGKIVSKKRGAVRASNKIVDNRENTTGNTGLTKFYQISGKKLEDGMLLEERPDFGLGVVAGACVDIGDGTYTGGFGRLEFNISPYVAKVTKKFFSDVRLFGEFRAMGGVSAYGGGICKEIHLMKRVKLTPFGQYLTDGTATYVGGGVRLPVYFSNWISLEPAFAAIGGVSFVDVALRIGF